VPHDAAFHERPKGDRFTYWSYGNLKRETTMASGIETTVCGNQVQIDRSGQGHAWQNIDAGDIPANIRMEIEGEMIDGGKDECDLYVATNGLHYRW
jgi:hypothetical protein